MSGWRSLFEQADVMGVHRKEIQIEGRHVPVWISGVLPEWENGVPINSSALATLMRKLGGSDFLAPLEWRPAFDRMWFEHTELSPRGARIAHEVRAVADDQYQVLHITHGHRYQHPFVYLLEQYRHSGELVGVLQRESIDGALVPIDVTSDWFCDVAPLSFYIAKLILNCRNVRMAEVPVKRAKKQRRIKPGDVVWREVVMASGNSTISGRTGPRQTDEEKFTRRHLMSGHRKTYTADAPLFGKHVGSWWWNPTHRGNADAGHVAQNRRVKAVAA